MVEDYTYNGDGLRASTTVGALVSSYSWDTASGDLPQLLSDGSTDYLYGPNGLPIEQTAPSPPITTVATGSALDSAGVATSLTVTFSSVAKTNDQILISRQQVRR